MKHQTISSKELSRILTIIDERTFLTTEGFPKSFFNEGEMTFNKSEVAKFLNVDNLDEQFINLEKGAEYLDITENRLHYLAYKNLVPSYRLKNRKGSSYLFRKSELESINNFTIEGNVDFLNYYQGTDVMRKLFMTYVDTHVKNKLKKAEYEIVCNYFIDRMSSKQIAKEHDLTPSRINQIFKSIIERMHKIIITTSETNINEIKQKIARQDNEIYHLKELLKLQDPILNSDYQETTELLEKYIFFLDKPIIDLDLTLRSLNAINYNTDSIQTTYDLIMNFNSYNGKFLKLLKIRNLGKTTYKDITDCVIQLEKDLQKLTGIRTESFLMNTPQSTTELVIFKQVNDYFKNKITKNN